MKSQGILFMHEGGHPDQSNSVNGVWDAVMITEDFTLAVSKPLNEPSHDIMVPFDFHKLIL